MGFPILGATKTSQPSVSPDIVSRILTMLRFCCGSGCEQTHGNSSSFDSTPTRQQQALVRRRPGMSHVGCPAPFRFAPTKSARRSIATVRSALETQG